MSINRQMGKHTVVYSYNELSKKKKETSYWFMQQQNWIPKRNRLSQKEKKKPDIQEDYFFKSRNIGQLVYSNRKL